jgi:hypothetical protein
MARSKKRGTKKPNLDTRLKALGIPFRNATEQEKAEVIAWLRKVS